MKTSVLVIDDDRSVRHTLKRTLESLDNVQVECVESGEEGLKVLPAKQPLVCLLDVYLGDENGLELYHQIRALDNKIPIIFITSDKSSTTAIKAMRAGAFDYLSKPIDVKQLKQLTVSAIRTRQLMEQPVALAVDENASDSDRFVGHSKEMIEVYKQIGRVAAQDVTVLIRGESGSGKELVSRALVDHSSRSKETFVAVNCAAIPEQLLESELFGHEQGAFTGADRQRIGRFEQCDGGTIFLDEVGDMSSMIQGKVLRLLQEQKFERVGGNQEIQTDVRVVAATNRPLEEMVENGEFREDLLYRLNGFSINLPPLRERSEDIPPLLEFFLNRAAKEMGRDELEGISPDALAILRQYDWPGNVRQLQSVVRQAVLNTTGTVVSTESLPPFLSETEVGGGEETAAEETAAEKTTASVESESETSTDGSGGTYLGGDWSLVEFIDQRIEDGSTDLYAEVIESVERELFARVLQATAGNQSRTSEILGITRGKVRDRIASYDITVDPNVNVGN